MTDHILIDIGKAILGAAVVGVPAHLLRVPLLLAYIIAGVILGPHLGLGIVKSADSIATLSEIGLVLLMFILGLEIDLKKLLQAGKAVLVNGTTQFLGCALLSIIFFKLVGVSQLGEYGLVYLAVACSLSSTLVVVKILSDRMELDTLTSRITLGILVLQDLWAIGFLAVQPNLANLSVTAIALSLGKAVVLVLTSWTAAKFLLPSLFAKAAKQPELMLIIAMAWCFSICGLADGLKLSVEMGALVAGVSIASFPYHFDVASKVASLRDFFITLFFVGLGLQIPSPTTEVVTLSGLIILFVLVSRIITVFPILHLLNYGNRASFIPGLNLSQLSEFSLVLAALGVEHGHISKDLMSAFVIAMVTTALLSSLFVPKGHDLAKFFSPILEKLGFKDHVGKGEEKAKDDHAVQVVLLGFHRDASSLLYEMLDRYTDKALKHLLVVDFNPEVHSRLKQMGVHCKYADISHSDTLRNLNLENAKLLVCTISDTVLKGITNAKLLNQLKNIAPQAQIVVTADTLSSAIQMYEQGAAYVFMPRLVGAHYLADVIERIQSEGPDIIRAKAQTYIKNRNEVIA